ncbi:hypothetical protein P9E76_00095 [Schinkia azotoformans]|uniref:Lipoprotein n=1 Tax=Schinkia azotoformans LMG 9581 TaxID=1131731 RepID=K6C0G5_SCHAZ|nr:hypothetical protein [Schinkia azotoformans]EKN64640.1 lipoprotein [Schinkia azotoformans LMG 9581]MEC1640048.1 hypothetical protein [Schinkia azotoformans]MEC1722635.1 hypothetical protein [Schinkia azotoformans]MEC1943486.1 hypothetical protein [Schinkia azotoformans]MED4415410.1 hypothetical protein [Schinkia azotoformans]
MKSKRTVATVVTIILSIFVLINLLKKDLWDVNAESLKKEVLTIGESVETVNLSDLTPFEWDVAYSFDPYASKDMIYATVGYKWDNISETVSEGMNQIVFMKDGKVVCYLYGYPENNGYGLYFTGENKTGVTSASVFSAEDDLTFRVVRSDGVIHLKNN